MNNGEKFWATIVIGVCLCICLFAGIMYHNYIKERVLMAEKGYELVSIVGVPYPVWQKAR